MKVLVSLSAISLLALTSCAGAGFNSTQTGALGGAAA